MELSIVKVAPGPRDITVTLRGDNLEAVTSSDAVQMAITASGMLKAGINGPPRGYPVHEDGTPLDPATPITADMRLVYQADIKVMPGF